ncbi:MAG: prepilin-type N-terminal cleavage/methylation domain-containing protein [Patescibacteria group bacterium]
MTFSQMPFRGFTLIELLVTVSIIGMLSSITLASTVQVREKAKIAKARSELAQLRNAIGFLAADTGRWPNGCIVGEILYGAAGSENEVKLNDTVYGGLYGASSPVVGRGGGCSWTNETIANWRGPYLQVNPIDPWGSDYWFDNDYEALDDCPGATNLPGTLAVILSLGPNKSGDPVHLYDCDDIYLRLY